MERPLGDQEFTLAFNHKANSLRVVEADEGVEWIYAFWFDWSAFRPQTKLFTSEGLVAQKPTATG